MLVADITPKPVLPVSVSFAGTPAEILYAGPAPGLIAGSLQINARVPNLSCNGELGPNRNRVPIQVGVGQLHLNGRPAYVSQGVATIAVKCTN